MGYSIANCSTVFCQNETSLGEEAQLLSEDLRTLRQIHVGGIRYRIDGI
jgi:hypothetical protein